jgi:hypothetical protein
LKEKRRKTLKFVNGFIFKVADGGNSCQDIKMGWAG